MTIERQRPLPPGRYWVDLFESNQGLSAWFAAMVQMGRVNIEHTEHFDAIDGAEAREFIIFRTQVDVLWPDEIVKVSPNVAPASIKSSADTAQRPEPEKDPLDNLPKPGDLAAAVKVVAVALTGVAVAVLVASLARSRMPRRR